MVIFPDADANIAAGIADRILKSVEAFSFQENVRVTLSGGVGEYSTESVPELIDKADKNLYEAKRSGKNRVIG